VHWLDSRELRVGLGCMRLTPDDDRALATIGAAVAAGMTVFDTAHAYGRHEHDVGGNERQLARALRSCRAETKARVVTKGGMTRRDGRWLADGRAGTIRRDCEASLAALDGLPIDLYLVHAPDPRTPWRTTVRALAKLLDERLVSRIGVSNVNRLQLDEAIELAPITAVEVGLSVFDDGALRGGLVELCGERGISLIAHSPLGGPRRAGRLERDVTLPELAAARGATAAQVALAWLLGLSPVVVAIPGARRSETARSAAAAATLELTPRDRAAIDERFGTLRARPVPVRRSREGGEVVLVMGIPGAGKSRLATEHAARGYARLNRDERGGSLRELAAALADELDAGTRRIVLDNTYLTRAVRSRPIEAAARVGLPVRCVWLDTPLAQAQVNIVMRLLEGFGALPSPEQLAERARREQGVLAPTAQMRAVRALEPPVVEEGFVSVERAAFARAPAPAPRGGVFVAASATERPGWERALADAEPDTPHLVFDWRPDGDVDGVHAAAVRIGAITGGSVEAAVCPHGGGPPICWCRPPLPGLPLAFAHAHGLDPGASTLVGHSAAHRTLARALGARYVEL
jgi:aryl-alcohol dehydrogenase-like predicted oxidoreductase/predicted kinase